VSNPSIENDCPNGTGKVREPDAQYKRLGIPVRFLLEDLPQSISARYFASVVVPCGAVRV
jgi:hypothetical protein